MSKEKKFEKELEDLINRHSKENESNTPDFILAQYMSNCLKNFNIATQQRETWYGRDARPSYKNKHDDHIEVKPGVFIHKRIIERGDIIDLLDEYSTWLTKNGYMDTDWKDEEPYAIDEFLKNYKK